MASKTKKINLKTHVIITPNHEMPSGLAFSFQDDRVLYNLDLAIKLAIATEDYPC